MLMTGWSVTYLTTGRCARSSDLAEVHAHVVLGRAACGQLPEASQDRAEGLDLGAAMQTAGAPFAEVLAVVREKTIAVFPESRAGASNDFSSLVGIGRMGPDPYYFASSEAFERDLLYRTSDQAERVRGVVDNASLADVNTVMQVTSARRHEMRTQGRLFPSCHKQVRVRRTGRPGCQ